MKELKPYCYICGKREIKNPIISSMSQEVDRAFTICSANCLKIIEGEIFILNTRLLQRSLSVEEIEEILEKWQIGSKDCRNIAQAIFDAQKELNENKM